MGVIAKDLDQKTFHDLRLIIIGSEIMMAVLCLVVLLLVNHTYDISLWMYSYFIALAASCYISSKVSTTTMLWLTGFLPICIGAACLGTLAVIIGKPMTWLLVIGMIMSLPISGMYSHWSHYFTSAVAIWLTLFCVITPQFETQLDLTLTLLTVGGSMALGAAVCVTFCRIRKNVFDLQQQLHGMAYSDALTGLPNRRAFMDRLGELTSSSVLSVPVYFFMIDIDDFKKINDRYGHDVGDLVLVAFAKILSDQAQGYNYARLGGEEFAVAACFSDFKEAQALAQRIIDAVNSSQVHDLYVSVSIGLSEYIEGETVYNFIRRADLALYEAKRNGKNQFSFSKIVSVE
ncbi:MAG: GGDEF domain-containing protein [Pseudomonas sp.]|nr:GGDEF domain-containing protein [Pseudomonas sp.]